MENYKNLTLNSVSKDQFSTSTLLDFEGIPYKTTYTFSGMYAKDLNLGKNMILKYNFNFLESVPILKNNANVLWLSISNIEFDGIIQSEGNWIFDTGYIQTITFTYVKLNNVTRLDEPDKTSGILLINTLDLNSQFDLKINNIIISNSSTSLV